jgi:SsrA-binding protein
LKPGGIKIVAKNKKARFDYEILSTYEAGLVLLGTEIKSIREGRIQLKDGFVRIESNEAYLHEVYIAPYSNAGPFNHEPTRPRKLLLHKREIRRLFGKVQEKGLSLVPLSLYLKNSKAKVELGLARGKRKYEKREAIKRQDAKREIERSLRQRTKEG